jgi:hypothetical protein
VAGNASDSSVSGATVFADFAGLLDTGDDAATGCFQRQCAGLAEENEDLRAAQQAFEGDAFREGEVHKDLALARCWPDFDSMLQAGEFDVLAKALYQPLLIWTETQVQVQMLDSGDAAQEKQDE